MAKRDFLLSLASAILIAIFLIPTLINTELNLKIPSIYLILFTGLPIVTLGGMTISSQIGKRISIFWQLAKFGLVGILNTAVDFGILNFFIAITQVTSGVGIVFINATSFSTALVNSFFWNRDWVFVAGKKSNFITFGIVTLIGLSLNTAIVYGLTTYVPPVLAASGAQWANLSKVLATLISLVWNFLGYKLVVFKK